MDMDKDPALRRKKQLTIESFTIPRKTRGRKRKKPRGLGGGRKTKAKLLAEATAVEHVVANQPRAKISRLAFNPGSEARAALEAAIDGWPLAKTRGVSMMAYCRKMQAKKRITISTLKAHLLGRRQLAGVQQRGRPSHLSLD